MVFAFYMLTLYFHLRLLNSPSICLFLPVACSHSVFPVDAVNGAGVLLSIDCELLEETAG